MFVQTCQMTYITPLQWDPTPMLEREVICDNMSHHQMSLKPNPWRELWADTETKDIDVFLQLSLAILFENSPTLENKLVPELAQTILSSPSVARPNSYHELVDIALKRINSWSNNDRASFIEGHPRIGEVGNLSALSEAEQASRATSPEVLSRLEYLNNQYERAFPGLRYITFVNGRSRGAQIVPEMEALLGLQNGNEGDVDVHTSGSPQWNEELDRAVKDIGLIAKSRLKSLEVD